MSTGKGTGSITIAPVSAVLSVQNRLQPSHVVSILGRKDGIEFPHIHAANILRLTFDDVGYTSEFGRAASTEDISNLISFARTWAGSGNLLIHCKAGTSRSPAAAMIALASIGILQLDQHLSKLLSLKNYYRPNSTMLRIADGLFNGEANLINAARLLRSSKTTQKIGPATLRF